MAIAPLRPDEIEQIECNIFWKARPIVRERIDFPWHRDAKKSPTAGRVESSQALAIEFFGTVSALSSKNTILETWISALRLNVKGPWKIETEALVPRDLLGEPRPTQIDALALGQGGVIVFECKFTEQDGGGCSQPSPIGDGAHKGQVQCTGSYEHQTNPVNGRASRCALTAKGIRYWEHVPTVMDFDPTIEYRPCPFRGGWYQWMRNLVTAAAMSKRDQIPAAFVVVYADGPFPMAQKVRSADWQRLDASVAGKAVPLRTASYQYLLKMALDAATVEERPILAELETWMNDKYAEVSG